ncbi:serologically defined colon cancer antigen 8 isoform X7 [Nannospalax galili]|uniref:serologically defined colon cancer antigen 8 isoform X7 n=1 Tax=Nannospalax galili TaxID=1026970 RepID=UPI00111C3842|nr:serologically defined colon cancer antigen 8 isoform X7 [Nannospalax galili]
MAKLPGNSTLEESLGQYQRSLRGFFLERANRSLHQLKCALREGNVTVEEDALNPSISATINNEDSGMAWHELQHSHAVNLLKALLHQQTSKENETSPPRRRKMSPSQAVECEEAGVPTVHNLVPVIHEQSKYIHHLEAEVKFCKGNLQDSWVKTGEDSRVDETATRQFFHGNGDTGKAASTGEAEKWKLELERLKLTYEAKSDILESQLTLLRKDLAEYQKNCEDLKERLKHKESLLAASTSSRVGGLCLKCAQHEAVLSQTHSNVHVQTVERLTKERDDLMSALVSLRSNLADAQQRETSAYEQVKHAVQMTEEANFEKTKALIQCEQLKNELERQTGRLEKELASQQEKRTFEKEMIKKEIAKEREDAQSKILVLSQNIAQLEAKVEKVSREKISAVSQLEEIQNQLTSQEVDVTKVCGEMRFQLNKTKMEKDEAEKEHREYRSKSKRDLESKDQVLAFLEFAPWSRLAGQQASGILSLPPQVLGLQEIEKLRLELSESKQHVEQEQQKAARAREECLHATELLGASEHQLHLTRLEKDSIQQSFSNEAKAQALQAQQREQELTQKIQQMQAQHDKTENEQYSLLASQNTFLTKLKEECCTLAKKLEQISQKSRLEIIQLGQEKRYVCDKLEKLQKRNDELEEQCVQHGKVHETMKIRLRQLDKHSQATAQQLVRLLNKQNQLLLERQNLSEEVDRLRAQLPSMPQSDC